MAKKNQYPIGVFDSGLGGLTAVKELMRQLPNEDIVYFGDTARVPYGTKSKEAIIRFSHENTQFLLRHKVKMVMVACNSSSSFALESLRKAYALPVVGVIVPGACKAVQMTTTQTVGVIATSATINSGEYERTIKGIDKNIRVINQACPLFVPLVEEGWFDNEVSQKTAQRYLRSLKHSKADVLILGCTHYPLLKSVIQKVMGPRVFLVDSAREAANNVKELLNNIGIANVRGHRGKYQFFVSDKPQHFKKLAKRFLGYEINHITKV